MGLQRPCTGATRFCWQFLAFAGVLVIAAGPTPAENGRYLPANTWVRLDAVPSERIIPRQFVDCTRTGTLTHPVGRRASSIAYGGDLFYFGGGGQSHPANDVELFDIAANIWVQQTVPECLPACCATDQHCDPGCIPIAGSGTTAITPLGNPYTEKTFQLVTYNPMRRRYTAALTSGLWEWDPVTLIWTRLTPERPMSTDIATKMLVYDPDLETVLYFATTQSNHTVFRFDYAANAWVAHGAIPTEISFAQIFSAYDSTAHRYLVSHGRGTFWQYDPADGSWTRLSNVPPEAIFRPGTDTNSMAFDPIAGVFLLAKRESASDAVELWTYRMSSDTWTRLEPAGARPHGPTTSYNGLAYDPTWRRFYFLNVRSVGGGGQGGAREGDVETWSYRIAGPVGPGDTDCKGSITAGDVLRVISVLGADAGSSPCGVFDGNRDGVINDPDLPFVLDGIFSAAF